MAQGFLKHWHPNWTVDSGGTQPASQVNPYAIRVMAEKGIDISTGKPSLVDDFLDQPYDYVITVCDHAREVCPLFTGRVLNRLHIGFDDPAEATGSPEEVLPVYRRVRDEIEEAFKRWNG